jgi:hypothetical protein
LKNIRLNSSQKFQTTWKCCSKCWRHWPTNQQTRDEVVMTGLRHFDQIYRLSLNPQTRINRSLPLFHLFHRSRTLRVTFRLLSLLSDALWNSLVMSSEIRTVSNRSFETGGSASLSIASNIGHLHSTSEMFDNSRFRAYKNHFLMSVMAMQSNLSVCGDSWATSSSSPSHDRSGRRVWRRRLPLAAREDFGNKGLLNIPHCIRE